jgi:hypothetical protein
VLAGKTAEKAPAHCHASRHLCSLITVEPFYGDNRHRMRCGACAI